MKTATIAALAAGFVLPACSSISTGTVRMGDSLAGRIAKDSHIPGKGVPGQCAVFAEALQAEFHTVGIPAEVIVYGYSPSAVPDAECGGMAAGSSGIGGAHAVVAYQDAGRIYVMDNQSWAPQWVRDGSTVQVAQRFSGINAEVRVARIEPAPSMPTRAGFPAMRRFAENQTLRPSLPGTLSPRRSRAPLGRRVAPAVALGFPSWKPVLPGA
jgi:hypothetical protein